MTGRRRERFPACALAATAIVAFAACAHVSAGGAIAGTGTIGMLLAVAVTMSIVLASVRWTFARLVIVTAAAQPLLHALFELFAPHGSPMPHDAHAMHHSAEQHAAMLPASAHPDSSMWIVHVVAALVTAVVLRWGWRWLSTMPELLRAIVYATSTAPVPGLLRRTRLIVADAAAPGTLALPTWHGRGPPRPV